MSNYIVKVEMNSDEYKIIQFMISFVGVTLSKKEHDLVATLLGYSSKEELITKGFKKNKYLKQASTVLGFLHSLSEDKQSLLEFFSRLVFTDKDVETRVRRTYNIIEEESLSPTFLQSAYNLECNVDEWEEYRKV